MDDFERKVLFSPEDEPLREDVSLLGSMLGDVLRTVGGRELFERVETARLTALRHRDGDTVADADLASELTGLDAAFAAELVRAFSAYFSVVNTAERVHRIRRRRHHLGDPDVPQQGSLAAVLSTLADRGVGLAQVRDILCQTHLVPVFTAHPTEATRRTILAKQQRIARALLDRVERPSMTPDEERAVTARLRTEIELMWQTEEQASVRPTVADEVEYVLFYLTEVVYRVVPAFYGSLENALDGAYGEGAGADLPFPLVRFGSWVGGDMDGNPNVGPDTILATLERQRHLVIDRYRAEVRRLFGHLSQSLSRVEVDSTIHDRCRSYRDRMPDVDIPARYDDMPYRVLLWLVWERLDATRRDAPEAYASAAEIMDDLDLVAASLRAQRGGNAGLALLRRLRLRVATFGFHLATLDIRQDADVHRDAAADLLGIDDFAHRSRAERVEILRAALGAPPETATASTPRLQRTLGVLRTIGDARRRFGNEAIGPYIISMAQGADDVLALLLLARAAGLAGDDGQVPLDIAPLLETVDDLAGARATLESMLADATYRRHVEARDGHQIVMLGYSDSAKISGIAASRWALYRAQEELVTVAETTAVGLTLFHGRGGTVGRGGSKPRAGILAEPRGAVRGSLRLTEQGEIVHAKYGLRDIAERTLELMAGAVIEATASCTTEPAPHPEWVSAMDTVASAGRAAYDALIHHDTDFDAYFRQATPIDVIERLEIGSRPASRRSGRGVANLRAIPWVFAWMQSRHLLPGWYGVGAGLGAAVEEHGEDILREMAARWPFFSNLLADVEMVLAKADMAIAARYATLADEVGERVYPRIRDHFDDTVKVVARLQGVQQVLDREPTLRRNIRLRNPYVDPMSVLQVDLLRRWRAGSREDNELKHALFETVRGIARGMQNTG